MGALAKRRIRLTAVWTAAAVAVAGGLFWASGGYDAWRHDRALDSACDGDLAAGPLRALLDGTEVTTEHISGARTWRCKVYEADREDGLARVMVSVQRADRRAVAVDAEPADAPLGNGWTGGFSFTPGTDEDGRGEASATILLDCGKEPGEGLIADVSARVDRADFTKAPARARLTELLTTTAMSYARRTGCAAKPGGAVVAPGVSATDPKPFAAVSGACAGVLDAATAARWGVRTAVESAAGPKAVEGCTLGGALGPLYELRATYGPFVGTKLAFAREAGPGDRADGHYYLTARCPGAGDTAVYEIDSPAEGAARPVPDHPGLRAALARFAAASAKTHGCVLERPSAGS
ncbi:hypothetical protein [Streptomyces tritici]|uniref:hypothetical protein n=1 Tax=Streptomyces tritici TaxID=2054410 RepID=UPI003AEFF648